MRSTILAAALMVLPSSFSSTIASAEEAPTDIGRQYRCQVCHVDRLREIRRPSGPLLIDPATITMSPSGEQDPASTRRMCFSCHDGFVEDARFIWTGEHRMHPVGVTLSEGMATGPAGERPILPLNSEDKVYCGTCHVAHPPRRAKGQFPLFVRVDPSEKNLCGICHAEKIGIAGSPHARVRKRQPPDFSERGLCGRCHTPHDSSGPMLWARDPGDAEVSVDRLCLSCHRRGPKPAHHPASVLAWSGPVRGALTDSGHGVMPVFDEHARRADTGAIGCATCHDPHSHRADGQAEDVEGRYLRKANPAGSLCADCHGSEALFRYQFFHSSKSR